MHFWLLLYNPIKNYSNSRIVCENDFEIYMNILRILAIITKYFIVNVVQNTCDYLVEKLGLFHRKWIFLCEAF